MQNLFLFPQSSTSVLSMMPTSSASPDPDPDADAAGDRRSSRNSGGAGPSDAEVVWFRYRADELISKADGLERKVNEVARFYADKKPARGGGRERNREGGSAGGSGGGGKKAGDGVPSKRMQDLMRQFGTILKQLAQHKWIWPFMEPVDVEGLGLHDYYQIIKKPMDFGTIRSRMEDKDGIGYYTHVREIYHDARLVFINAMQYNIDEKHDIHVMAKSLLDKLEEKWLPLLPKVIEEETRQKEEETRSIADIQVAQESAIARAARDAANELNEVEMHLEEFRQMVIQKCRKITVHEKRKLGAEISSLCPEDLDKALEIIAQGNPNFQATSDSAVIDMDAQSQTTLRKLKFFVEQALECRSKSNRRRSEENSRRKREIFDALSRSAKKHHRK